DGKRADKDCSSFTLRTDRHVPTPVDAVGPVDVGRAGRPKHWGAPVGDSPVTVTGGVSFVVCLSFDDTGNDPLVVKRADYNCTEERERGCVGVGVQLAARKRGKLAVEPLVRVTHADRTSSIHARKRSTSQVFVTCDTSTHPRRACAIPK